LTPKILKCVKCQVKESKERLFKRLMNSKKNREKQQNELRQTTQDMNENLIKR
jgi:hypothetical protein